jgi:hypothetical protein
MTENPHYNRDNKFKLVTMVWGSTQNGRKYNLKKRIIYESGKTMLRNRSRNRW